MADVPVIYFREQAAVDAYAAIRALDRAEEMQPALTGNRFWKALRKRARERFENAFVVDG